MIACFRSEADHATELSERMLNMLQIEMAARVRVALGDDELLEPWIVARELGTVGVEDNLRQVISGALANGGGPKRASRLGQPAVPQPEPRSAQNGRSKVQAKLAPGAADSAST